MNLKIIGTTPINTKISTRGQYLNHEPAGYVPESFRRWWVGDSREETIKKLDRIINRAILYLEVIDHPGTRLGLYALLESSMNGFVNIKDTYSTCIQTSARLETIIDKVTVVIVVEEERNRVHEF